MYFNIKDIGDFDFVIEIKLKKKNHDGQFNALKNNTLNIQWKSSS